MCLKSGKVAWKWLTNFQKLEIPLRLRNFTARNLFYIKCWNQICFTEIIKEEIENELFERMSRRAGNLWSKDFLSRPTRANIWSKDFLSRPTRSNIWSKDFLARPTSVLKNMSDLEWHPPISSKGRWRGVGYHNFEEWYLFQVAH